MDNVSVMNEQIAEGRVVEEVGEKISVVDFKMVTFSLANKDYAINIMQVKEIAKAGNFTYVPNTSPFVLGVYNLRGDIIPVIDLRIFFNIPVKMRKKDQIESMVIITVEEQTFGVVVDSIDKVVGISSASIQPPHPIFGDINIKYIHGVVENAGRLYVLLDVNKIFASKLSSSVSTETVVEEPFQQRTEEKKADASNSNEKLGIRFISDTLAAYGKFFPSPVNEDWISKRYVEWANSRSPSDLQIQNEADAENFLSSFTSPSTKKIWSEEYFQAMLQALPENNSKTITAWNVGCSLGYEAFSFAVLLKTKYPRASIKIFANDSDLLAISGAPMLTVPQELTDTLYGKYLVKGTNGAYSFNKEIKDMILFEYHDCVHQNSVPDVDIILARDVLSFLTVPNQTSILSEFREKLKNTGIVILGANEAMPKHDGWLRHQVGEIVNFSKE